MKSIYTTQLTSTQKQQVKNLVSQCRQAEPLSLSAPLEDDLDYFLLYQGEELCSMLFLFFPQKTLCECGAFTLPSYRRTGCFSLLLQKAMDFMESYESNHGYQVDFCFLTDDRTPSARQTLQALDASFWYSEYKMERSLGDSDQDHTSALRIQDAGDHIYTAVLEDQIIGTCILLPQGKSIYFYGFEIKESLRRKGYGEEFLLSILAMLTDKNYTHISLQVSGQNLAALSLYQKTGFQITETLSYYLY